MLRVRDQFLDGFTAKQLALARVRVEVSCCWGLRQWAASRNKRVAHPGRAFATVGTVPRTEWVITPLRKSRRVGHPPRAISASTVHAPSSSLFASSIRVRIRGALMEFRFCASSARCVSLLAFVFAECSCVCHEFFLNWNFVIGKFGNFESDCRICAFKHDFKLLNYQITKFIHAFSSCAYFSTNFFNPKRGNCTVSLASSPSPSR